MYWMHPHPTQPPANMQQPREMYTYCTVLYSRPPPHPLSQDEGLGLFVNTTGVPYINPVLRDIGSNSVLSLYFSKLSEYQLRLLY
jgi:hypothetical protein